MQFDLSASTLDVTDETSVEVLAATRRDADELRVVNGIELIDSAPCVDWTPYVIPLLSHPSEEVRARALRCLGRSGDEALSGAVAGLLNAPEESVRAAAGEALCNIAGPRAVQRVA